MSQQNRPWQPPSPPSRTCVATYAPREQGVRGGVRHARGWLVGSLQQWCRCSCSAPVPGASSILPLFLFCLSGPFSHMSHAPSLGLSRPLFALLPEPWEQREHVGVHAAAQWEAASAPLPLYNGPSCRHVPLTLAVPRVNDEDHISRGFWCASAVEREYSRLCHKPQQWGELWRPYSSRCFEASNVLPVVSNVLPVYMCTRVLAQLVTMPTADDASCNVRNVH